MTRSIVFLLALVLRAWGSNALRAISLEGTLVDGNATLTVSSFSAKAISSFGVLCDRTVSVYILNASSTNDHKNEEPSEFLCEGTVTPSNASSFQLSECGYDVVTNETRVPVRVCENTVYAMTYGEQSICTTTERVLCETLNVVYSQTDSLVRFSHAISVSTTVVHLDNNGEPLFHLVDTPECLSVEMRGINLFALKTDGSAERMNTLVDASSLASDNLMISSQRAVQAGLNTSNTLRVKSPCLDREALILQGSLSFSLYFESDDRFVAALRVNNIDLSMVVDNTFGAWRTRTTGYERSVRGRWLLDESIRENAESQLGLYASKEDFYARKRLDQTALRPGSTICMAQQLESNAHALDLHRAQVCMVDVESPFPPDVDCSFFPGFDTSAVLYDKQELSQHQNGSHVLRASTLTRDHVLESEVTPPSVTFSWLDQHSETVSLRGPCPNSLCDDSFNMNNEGDLMSPYAHYTRSAPNTDCMATTVAYDFPDDYINFDRIELFADTEQMTTQTPLYRLFSHFYPDITLDEGLEPQYEFTADAHNIPVELRTACLNGNNGTFTMKYTTWTTEGFGSADVRCLKLFSPTVEPLYSHNGRSKLQYFQDAVNYLKSAIEFKLEFGFAYFKAGTGLLEPPVLSNHCNTAEFIKRLQESPCLCDRSVPVCDAVKTSRYLSTSLLRYLVQDLTDTPACSGESYDFRCKSYWMNRFPYLDFGVDLVETIGEAFEPLIYNTNASCPLFVPSLLRMRNDFHLRGKRALLELVLSNHDDLHGLLDLDTGLDDIILTLFTSSQFLGGLGLTTEQLVDYASCDYDTHFFANGFDSGTTDYTMGVCQNTVISNTLSYDVLTFNDTDHRDLHSYLLTHTSYPSKYGILATFSEQFVVQNLSLNVFSARILVGGTRQLVLPGVDQPSWLRSMFPNVTRVVGENQVLIQSATSLRLFHDNSACLTFESGTACFDLTLLEYGTTDNLPQNPASITQLTFQPKVAPFTLSCPSANQCGCFVTCFEVRPSALRLVSAQTPLAATRSVVVQAYVRGELFDSQDAYNECMDYDKAPCEDHHAFTKDLMQRIARNDGFLGSQFRDITDAEVCTAMKGGIFDDYAPLIYAWGHESADHKLGAFLQGLEEDNFFTDPYFGFTDTSGFDLLGNDYSISDKYPLSKRLNTTSFSAYFLKYAACPQTNCDLRETPPEPTPSTDDDITVTVTADVLDSSNPTSDQIRTWNSLVARNEMLNEALRLMGENFTLAESPVPTASSLGLTITLRLAKANQVDVIGFTRELLAVKVFDGLNVRFTRGSFSGLTILPLTCSAAIDLTSSLLPTSCDTKLAASTYVACGECGLSTCQPADGTAPLMIPVSETRTRMGALYTNQSVFSPSEAWMLKAGLATCSSFQTFFLTLDQNGNYANNGTGVPITNPISTVTRFKVDKEGGSCSSPDERTIGQQSVFLREAIAEPNGQCAYEYEITIPNLDLPNGASIVRHTLEIDLSINPLFNDGKNGLATVKATLDVPDLGVFSMNLHQTLGDARPTLHLTDLGQGDTATVDGENPFVTLQPDPDPSRATLTYRFHEDSGYYTESCGYGWAEDPPSCFPPIGNYGYKLRLSIEGVDESAVVGQDLTTPTVNIDSISAFYTVEYDTDLFPFRSENFDLCLANTTEVARALFPQSSATGLREEFLYTYRAYKASCEQCKAYNRCTSTASSVSVFQSGENAPATTLSYYSKQFFDEIEYPTLIFDPRHFTASELLRVCSGNSLSEDQRLVCSFYERNHLVTNRLLDGSIASKDFATLGLSTGAFYGLQALPTPSKGSLALVSQVVGLGQPGRLEGTLTQAYLSCFTNADCPSTARFCDLKHRMCMPCELCDTRAGEWKSQEFSRNVVGACATCDAGIETVNPCRLSQCIDLANMALLVQKENKCDDFTDAELKGLLAGAQGMLSQPFYDTASATFLQNVSFTDDTYHSFRKLREILRQKNRQCTECNPNCTAPAVPPLEVFENTASCTLRRAQPGVRDCQLLVTGQPDAYRFARGFLAQPGEYKIGTPTATPLYPGDYRCSNATCTKSHGVVCRNGKLYWQFSNENNALYTVTNLASSFADDSLILEYNDRRVTMHPTADSTQVGCGPDNATDLEVDDGGLQCSQTDKLVEVEVRSITGLPALVTIGTYSAIARTAAPFEHVRVCCSRNPADFTTYPSDASITLYQSQVNTNGEIDTFLVADAFRCTHQADIATERRRGLLQDSGSGGDIAQAVFEFDSPYAVTGNVASPFSYSRTEFDIQSAEHIKLRVSRRVSEANSACVHFIENDVGTCKSPRISDNCTAFFPNPKSPTCDPDALAMNASESFALSDCGATMDTAFAVKTCSYYSHIYSDGTCANDLIQTCKEESFKVVNRTSLLLTSFAAEQQGVARLASVGKITATTKNATRCNGTGSVVLTLPYRLKVYNQGPYAFPSFTLKVKVNESDAANATLQQDVTVEAGGTRFFKIEIGNDVEICADSGLLSVQVDAVFADHTVSVLSQMYPSGIKVTTSDNFDDFSLDLRLTNAPLAANKNHSFVVAAPSTAYGVQHVTALARPVLPAELGSDIVTVFKADHITIDESDPCEVRVFVFLDDVDFLLRYIPNVTVEVKVNATLYPLKPGTCGVPSLPQRRKLLQDTLPPLCLETVVDGNLVSVENLVDPVTSVVTQSDVCRQNATDGFCYLYRGDQPISPGYVCLNIDRTQDDSIEELLAHTLRHVRMYSNALATPTQMISTDVDLVLSDIAYSPVTYVETSLDWNAIQVTAEHTDVRSFYPTITVKENFDTVKCTKPRVELSFSDTCANVESELPNACQFAPFLHADADCSQLQNGTLVDTPAWSYNESQSHWKLKPVENITSCEQTDPANLVLDMCLVQYAYTDARGDCIKDSLTRSCRQVAVRTVRDRNFTKISVEPLDNIARFYLSVVEGPYFNKTGPDCYEFYAKVRLDGFEGTAALTNSATISYTKQQQQSVTSLTVDGLEISSECVNLGGDPVVSNFVLTMPFTVNGTSYTTTLEGSQLQIIGDENVLSLRLRHTNFFKIQRDVTLPALAEFTNLTESPLGSYDAFAFDALCGAVQTTSLDGLSIQMSVDAFAICSSKSSATAPIANECLDDFDANKVNRMLFIENGESVTENVHRQECVNAQQTCKTCGLMNPAVLSTLYESKQVRFELYIIVGATNTETTTRKHRMLLSEVDAGIPQTNYVPNFPSITVRSPSTPSPMSPPPPDAVSPPPDAVSPPPPLTEQDESEDDANNTWIIVLALSVMGLVLIIAVTSVAIGMNRRRSVRGYRSIPYESQENRAAYGGYEDRNTAYTRADRVRSRPPFKKHFVLI